MCSNKEATRNKCIASSNKGLTSSNKAASRNKKLLVTSASLLGTSALLVVVTRKLEPNQSVALKADLPFRPFGSWCSGGGNYGQVPTAAKRNAGAFCVLKKSV